MCYDVKFLTQKKLIYAKRRGELPEEISKIENDLNELTKNMLPQYCVSGFLHPQLLIFSQQSPNKPEFYKWGLIPNWIKDEKSAMQIRDKTINARVESLFEKPAFKSAVQNQRCFVMVDGFYEHHHFNGKSYPYFIFNKDGAPMVFAGIYDEWTDITGKSEKSVSIVTTRGIGVMKEIHNSPKLREPRMPLMLTKETESYWLKDFKAKDDVLDLVESQKNITLDAYTVNPIRAKMKNVNVESASNKRIYEELSQGKLF